MQDGSCRCSSAPGRRHGPTVAVPAVRRRLSSLGQYGRVTTHDYTLTVTWTGNRGPGTNGTYGCARGHVISAAGKPGLPGSSDPSFLGDATR